MLESQIHYVLQAIALLLRGGANGRNSTMWPGSTFRYRQIVDRLNPADYEIRYLPQALTTA